MNIDGHKFNFPEKPLKAVPPLEKVYPTKNSLENKNPEYPENEGEKKPTDDKEKKRQEKNRLEDKGGNLDVTI